MASPRVALVETSDALPGLLPFQAWDVLGTAETVLVRDPDAHPSALHLHLAGLDLVRVEPAQLDRGDLDLTRPGGPEDRRIAKALLQHAVEHGVAVFLLGPDDTGVAPALAGMAAGPGIEIELVLLAQQPPGAELLRLVEVLRRLRDPDTGCPWDLEQDHASLVRYLVEEAYELVDAIESGTDEDLREELGDVLLQVVFHAQVATDRRAFGIDDVARALVDKLVRRHPHVFGDGDARTADEVQVRWDQLKAAEKARSGPFDGVPAAGPGLELLATLQRRAARHGLLPTDDRDALTVVREQLAALEDAAARSDGGVDDDGTDRRAEQLGELLAAVVAVARQLDLDPEAAARASARRFRARLAPTDAPDDEVADGAHQS